eukprot:3941788-Alexandrium_andersonii.AAC.1
MSASLVGSEMCIRDRRPPLCHGSDSGRREDFRHRRAHLPGRCTGSEPVSYTHLTLPTICSV